MTVTTVSGKATPRGVANAAINYNKEDLWKLQHCKQRG